jgi:uncharacterized membrane protein
MKNTAADSSVQLSDLLFDLLGLLCLFVWISGGLIGLPPELHQLFSQKPWIHRLLMSAAGFAGVGLLTARPALSGRSTPMVHFFSTLRISHKQWIAILFVLLTWVFTVSSWARHQVFHTSFDMAIFTQAVWNTAHGHFLYSSIKGGICLLGDHFSPILAVLAVPYRFWPDPKILLFFQAAAAAACVFPLDQLARMELRRKTFAFLMVLTFALYLPVRNAVRFDFHPEILAMPLLLLAFVDMRRGRLIRSSLYLMLALSTKENAALVTFMTGFYALIFAKKRAYGLFWMAFSILYFFFIIKVIIPQLAPQGYFYLDANFLAWKREGAPALIQHLAQPSSLAYLVKIFMPVGFISFLDFPSFLLTLPMLAQNLLARNDAARSIFFQYTALLTPFVFISAVYGAKKILKKKWGSYYLLFCAILMAGVSESYVIHEHQSKETPHLQAVRRHLSQIPPEVSVRTHEFFAPHVAHRKELHIYENQHPMEGGSAAAQQAAYVAVDNALLGSSAAEKLAELRQRGYEEKISDGGFHIFIKS